MKQALLVVLMLIVECAMSAETASEIDARLGRTPFDYGKAGRIATIDFHVSWFTERYPRIASLTIVSPTRLYNEGSYSYVKRVARFTESLTGLLTTHVVGPKPKPHEGVRVHVLWKAKDTGEVLKEETLYSDIGNERVRCGGDIAFALSGIKLPAGDYTVTAEALDDDPRFDGEFKTYLCEGGFG